MSLTAASQPNVSIAGHPVRSLILDMDGVIWRGDKPLGDLPAIFKRIRQLGLRTILATNNSTRTPEQYLERLAGYGVILEPWQVITSSQAVAHHLRKQSPAGGGVFYIGEDGLRQALLEEGFTLEERSWEAIAASGKPPVAVVVGMDRQVTYPQLSLAALLIRSGTPFIGTNPDRTFPMPYGLVPGTGAFLAALQAATEVAPFIVGKPAPEMYAFALERLGTQPAETLVVGDRAETDIAGAQPLECLTALVLSGVTSPEQAQRWQPAPTVIARDLGEVIERLETSTHVDR